MSDSTESREDVFTLTRGRMIICRPPVIGREDYDDLIVWWSLMATKIRRSVLEGPSEQPTIDRE